MRHRLATPALKKMINMLLILIFSAHDLRANFTADAKTNCHTKSQKFYSMSRCLACLKCTEQDWFIAKADTRIEKENLQSQ